MPLKYPNNAAAPWTYNAEPFAVATITTNVYGVSPALSVAEYYKEVSFGAQLISGRSRTPAAPGSRPPSRGRPHAARAPSSTRCSRRSSRRPRRRHGDRRQPRLVHGRPVRDRRAALRLGRSRLHRMGEGVLERHGEPGRGRPRVRPQLRALPRGQPRLRGERDRGLRMHGDRVRRPVRHHGQHPLDALQRVPEAAAGLHRRIDGQDPLRRQPDLHAGPDRACGPIAVRGGVPTGSANRTYWLEFRQPIGFDSALSAFPNNGAQIRVARRSRTTARAAPAPTTTRSSST